MLVQLGSLAIDAESKFQPLSRAEMRVLDAINNNMIAICFEDEDQIDTDVPETFKDIHTIRAEFLAWLCAHAIVKEQLRTNGLRIFGAKIDGDVLLDRLQIDFPLNFGACIFTSHFSFAHATICELYFDEKSRVGQIFGPFATITSSFSFHGVCMGGINMNGCRVAGNISLTHAQVHPQLEGVSYLLPVDDGQLLSMVTSVVSGSIYIDDGFVCFGQVRLVSTKIAGDLTCKDAQIINPSGFSLIMSDAVVEREISFEKLVSIGELRMVGIKANAVSITDSFLVHGASNVYNLTFDRSDIASDVYMDACNFAGEMHIIGAVIRGSMEMRNIEFVGSTQQISNMLKALEVDLALRADQPDAEVYCAFTMEFTKIEVKFVWRKITVTPSFVLDLLSTKVGHFLFDETGWPTYGNLVIDGFTYTELRSSDFKYSHWLNIIRRQGEYHQRPYEQFISYLRQGGRADEVIKVAIAHKNDYYRTTRWWQRVGGAISKVVIGYGYKPYLSLVWAAVVIIAGTMTFAYAHGEQLLIAVDKPEHVAFSAFMFSVDTFVPIIDFNHSQYWIPDAVNSQFIQVYYWTHILAGWFFSTIAVLGFSGAIKKS